jgi:hypothetical protein
MQLLCTIKLNYISLHTSKLIKKMKLQNVFLFALMFSLPVWFTACNDDDNGPDDTTDTTPPEIEVLRPESGEVREIREGEESRNLHFRANVSDNVELGEMHIDVHHAFDDHTHGKNFEPFHYDKVFDLTGTRDTFIDYDAVIPNTTIPGEYHLTIEVTDKAGNALADGVKNISFEITNANFGPVWTVNSPEQGSFVNRGEELEIDIEIEGFVDVEEINFEMIHKDTEEVVYDFHRDHLHADPYHFRRTVVTQTEWPAGEYILYIEVELENGKYYHLYPVLEIILQ